MVDAKIEQVPVPSIGTSGSGVEDVNATKGVLQAEPRDTGTEPGEKQPDDKPKEVAPFNEHPRFKELVAQKNSLKSEVEQMKAQLAQISAKSVPTQTDVSRVKNIVKRLVETSTMDETNANALVDDILAEVDTRTKAKISPLEEDYSVRSEQQRRVQKADDNWAKFKGSVQEEGDEIDGETEKKMQSLFMKLSPAERQQVSLDETHFGLKMLYRMAKDGKESITPEKPAAPSAPKTGSVAGKGTGSSATAFKFKKSEILAWSPEEFQKNESAYLAARDAGLIDLNS